MSFYTLRRTQFLPISLDQAWDFFSSPDNLRAITPEYMDFNVTSIQPTPKMYEGQIITYTVKPVLGIPMRWMTEITHVESPVYFVDEQRIGPYVIWHHEHHFIPKNGGVEMTDIVNYVLPFGIFGRIAHALFIRKQLEGIFDYRIQVLEKKFGKA